ncbi:MAG: peptidase domain-containing ABC transporter [Coriobacteriales bacterium]|jgi:ATP-binding cassette subfamily B protein|nr:peptidase domain-containing ABC transporter [Coriobacteriales bacterium]
MRYTFVKQHDITDCAAACLAMVCLHYKKETTITRLRDMMGTDIKGTNLIGLAKCADELGFVSQAVKVDRQGFLSEYTRPCIANVHTREGLSHFVVVFKVGREHVVVGDPAKDLERVTVNDFYRTFTGNLLLLKPDNRFQKGRVKGEKVFGRFVKLLLPQKKLFVFSILASLIMTVLGIASSLFNKIVMDEILPYELRGLLLSVLLIFAAVALTQVLIQFVRSWMMLFLSQRIDIPLMLGYFEHIYKLPMRFFATRKTGDIITRFSDAFTIKDIFTGIALTLIMDVAMALITGVILFRMNATLFGIIALLTLVSVILVLCFRLPYKKINLEQMQQASILNSEIIEGLNGVETIKGNANEEAELESIEREYIKSLRIAFREGMLSNTQGAISGAVGAIGNLVLMYFGVLQVIDNEITLGTLMAFMTLAGFFMDPVQRLVGLQLQIQEANISMKRVSEILDYEQEQEGAERRQPFEGAAGDVAFKGVTFRYGNRKPVLHDVSFSIPRGQKLALVGASGSGKSTVAKLLLKYYEPEAGSVTIDGVDIEEYSNDSLRRGISYVPQRIELFSKSVYDNIRVTKMDSTLEEVKEAAKAADAHDFIRRLPLQYHTFLEESGSGLSGGEQQRIAIARAFLKENDLYVLDESTSNLDFGTERVVFDMIYNRLKGKTMLIIAHRLSTVRNCDRIVVLDKGEVVEQGSHEELLAREGVYWRLWEMQQGNVVAGEKNGDGDGKEIPESLDDDTISYL